MSEDTPTPILSDRPEPTLSASDPKRIGERYVVLDRLGEGGMGKVYLALDPVVNRKVAVKVLRFEDRSGSLLQRFQKEARVIARLNHPGIVTAFDFGLSDRMEPFLVMEYLEGRTLSDLISERGSLDFSSFKTVFSQVIAAMRHAHEKGVVHRDLKPSNILIQNQGGNLHVFVLDFGIAKLAQDEASQKTTKTGLVVGSPKYVSPEHVMGKSQDSRSDIYSLGCVMYESLTGVPPFEGHSAIETMQMHVDIDPPALSERLEGVLFSDDLEAFVQKALAKDVSLRYQSMEDLLRDLHSTFSGDADLPPSLPTNDSISTEPSKRVPLRRLLLMVGLPIATAGIFGFLATHYVPDFELGFGINRALHPASDNEKRRSVNQNASGKVDQKAVALDKSSADYQLLLKGKTNKALELNLSGTRVSNSQLENLSYFPNLDKLLLADTKITGESLGCIVVNAPQLVALDLSGVSFSPGEIAKLQDLSELKFLRIDNTGLARKHLESIRELEWLETLSLRDNHLLTDEDLMILDGMKDLRILDVNGTSATEAGLGPLRERNEKLRIDFSAGASEQTGLVRHKKRAQGNGLEADIPDFVEDTSAFDLMRDQRLRDKMRTKEFSDNVRSFIDDEFESESKSKKLGTGKTNNIGSSEKDLRTKRGALRRSGSVIGDGGLENPFREWDKMRYHESIFDKVNDVTRESRGHLKALEDLSSDRIYQEQHVNLENLTLNKSHFDRLSRCKSLVSIGLGYTNVSDEDLLKLSKLPHLRKLYLTGTRISPEGLMNAFGKRRPPLTAQVSNCVFFKNKDLKALSVWAGVQFIDL